MMITRFAPSPTGELHLGHVASALFAFETAQAAGGHFLLRIEDIDPVRCKPCFIQSIFDDLAWLGLSWPSPVRLQSEHMVDYARALERLRERGLLYPCFCTRSEVMAEALASGHAPHGPEGPLYPGTCRYLSAAQKQDLAGTRAPVWRLDVEKAMVQAGPLIWRDGQRGEITARPQDFGDVVLARRDVAASYHLSVTVDDAIQGISHVTRGEDLLRVTDIHRLLQALLGLPVPAYHHHPLLRDAAGKRFAKRDQAVTIRALREAGQSPEQIRHSVSFSGLPR